MSDLKFRETQLWSDVELAAAVDAYLSMLVQQIEGKPLNKAAIARELQRGALSSRSIGSIGQRMSNISSVMYGMKMPQVQGYGMRDNVGSAIKYKIIDLLMKGGLQQIAPYAPTSDQRELAQRVTTLRKSGVAFIPPGKKIVAQVIVTTTTYVRDPAVKAWVLHAADGRCEGCFAAAPFSGVDGLPYLEVHHVMPLSDYGSDRITNAAALCPNCHSRCHRSLDRDEFRLQLYEQITRLEMEVPDGPADETTVLIDVD
jgi:5-methylcytosine-specific restriction protein A